MAKWSSSKWDDLEPPAKPAVEEDWTSVVGATKIEGFEKKSKSKSKKSKKKKDKKQKKKSKKHRKHSSSSSNSSSDSISSSSEDDKTKKKKKKKKKRKPKDSSSQSEGEQWVERRNTAPPAPKSERDSWMKEGSLMLKTFTKVRPEKTESKQSDTYDPQKNSLELNPYWKITGTGLPGTGKVGFQKPREEDSDEGDKNLRRIKPLHVASSRWQKDTSCSHIANRYSPENSQAKPKALSNTDDESGAEPVVSTLFLTDKQMNELGAKAVKADLMGNKELAEKLRNELEEARAVRNDMEKQQLQGNKVPQTKAKRKNEEEHILLSHTDERGNSRPLQQSRIDPRDLYGGRSKKQKTRVETHVGGERVRFFPDDDKYDIKQMFEREKYTSASDSNLEFANITAKHKNPNDDLDEIFADKIRKNVSEEKNEKKNLQRAIHEHEKLSAQLEKCEKCFESQKFDRKLVVTLGEKVYLRLPWYIGLQPGHCIISPRQHVTCSTQLDEDAWEEVNDFRRAITRMFAAQRKDVIFFEIANKLHRRPHLSIHCIPIPDKNAEEAPFYFKKAIEESEYEWCVNKQLVSLRNKNLRNSIPKGLPYLWVNFGMDSGFAHVIEDENRFPPNFAQEIIGGLLRLEPNKWRKQVKEQNIGTKVTVFGDWWKKYDCTN